MIKVKVILIRLFAIFILLLLSCVKEQKNSFKDESPSNKCVKKDEFRLTKRVFQYDLVDNIKEYYKKNPQVFRIRANVDTFITCKQGTQIKIYVNSILQNNKVIKDGIIVLKVVEYYKISDIILANLTTMSDDKPLVTAGMIDVRAEFNNKKCEINTKKPLRIGFPSKTNNREFKLFYGEFKNNNVNWKYGGEQQQNASKIEDDFSFNSSRNNGRKYIVIPPSIKVKYKNIEKYLSENLLQKYKQNLYPDKNLISNITILISPTGEIINMEFNNDIPIDLKNAVEAIFPADKFVFNPAMVDSIPMHSKIIINMIIESGKIKITPLSVQNRNVLIQTVNLFTNEIQNPDYKEGVCSLSKLDFYFFTLTNFGLINCDFFSKIKSYNYIKIPIEKDNEYLMKFIYDNRLILYGYRYGNEYILKVPNLVEDEINGTDNKNKIIISFMQKNNELYFASEKVKVNMNMTLNLKYKKTTMKLLKKEVEKNLGNFSVQRR